MKKLSFVYLLILVISFSCKKDDIETGCECGVVTDYRISSTAGQIFYYLSYERDCDGSVDEVSTDYDTWINFNNGDYICWENGVGVAGNSNNSQNNGNQNTVTDLDRIEQELSNGILYTQRNDFNTNTSEEVTANVTLTTIPLNDGSQYTWQYHIKEELDGQVSNYYYLPNERTEFEGNSSLGLNAYIKFNSTFSPPSELTFTLNSVEIKYTTGTMKHYTLSRF